MEVAGLGPALFCHATPRDDEEVVLADSRLERGRIAAESSYPAAAEWADLYLNARASDAEALAVIAPRDGRESPSAHPA